ncbi:splicing factor [Ascosphaera acerosa]|nr:splicing factor [Ascosphaera acerosa]
MAAEQRKLLEQLMGAEQMVGFGVSRSQQLSITDPKVCRSYLAGTCPHDLFTNTKQDLGPCSKLHPENLKAEYEAAAPAEKAKWGFEYDYMRDLQKYLVDCDRRIETAQRRLEKTPDEIRQTNELLRRISDISESINDGLLEVRVLGELGSVSTALLEYHKVRTAKHQKETYERELQALQDNSAYWN